MENTEILKQLQDEILYINSFESFDEYFNNSFNTSKLKGVKLRIFKRMAKDFYNAGLSNCVVTKYKLTDLQELINTGSISYMGKYMSFSVVKVNEFACNE